MIRIDTWLSILYLIMGYSTFKPYNSSQPCKKVVVELKFIIIWNLSLDLLQGIHKIWTWLNAIFSRPTSFLQKSSWRVSSEKNILNSSVESCGVESCRVMLRKVYFPTHVLFIINAYAELSRSRTLLDFPKHVYYQYGIRGVHDNVRTSVIS